MSFRPQLGLLRKFEFSLWGDRERALAGAKHFASLLEQYLKEFDSMKKTTRTEFLDKHGVKAKRTLHATRQELQERLVNGFSPVCEEEMKQFRKNPGVVAASEPPPAVAASAEAIGEGVFPDVGGSYQVVFDTGVEKIMRVFPDNEKAQSYFNALLELRNSNKLAGAMKKLKLETASTTELLKAYSTIMHKQELQVRVTHVCIETCPNPVTVEKKSSHCC